MLKNIPSIISPELLKTLMEMGHGDEIVIGDGNFPGHSVAGDRTKIIRCDGHGVPEIMDAILKLMPLDDFVAQPVILMDAGELKPEIWDTYKSVVEKNEPKAMENGFLHLERYDFYDRASKAYAFVMTGESAIYANVILKKGIVKE